MKTLKTNSTTSDADRRICEEIFDKNLLEIDPEVEYKGLPPGLKDCIIQSRESVIEQEVVAIKDIRKNGENSEYIKQGVVKLCNIRE
jgi:hypothetical protein